MYQLIVFLLSFKVYLHLLASKTNLKANYSLLQQVGL